MCICDCQLPIANLQITFGNFVDQRLSVEISQDSLIGNWKLAIGNDTGELTKDG